MTKPISPDEAVEQHEIPGFVFEVVNELLRKRSCGGRVVLKQDEIVEAILAANASVTRQAIFDNHWLDIERPYTNIGWTVEYDKPGFNEEYEATFTFTHEKPSCR